MYSLAYNFTEVSEIMANFNAKNHFTILIKSLKLWVQLFKYFNNHFSCHYSVCNHNIYKDIEPLIGAENSNLPTVSVHPHSRSPTNCNILSHSLNTHAYHFLRSVGQSSTYHSEQSNVRQWQYILWCSNIFYLEAISELEIKIANQRTSCLYWVLVPAQILPKRIFCMLH